MFSSQIYNPKYSYKWIPHEYCDRDVEGEGDAEGDGEGDCFNDGYGYEYGYGDWDGDGDWDDDDQDVDKADEYKKNLKEKEKCIIFMSVLLYLHIERLNA